MTTDSKSSVRSSYDEIGDVLYVSLPAIKIRRTKTNEVEEGLVLRYDLETNNPVGVTVIDYKEAWLPEMRTHLVDRLSHFFGISQASARRLTRVS